MPDKIDEMYGFLCGVSQKSGRSASGEMVDALNSETLIENPGEKGVLSDGVRVSEEAKVLDGESKSGAVISGTELKSVEFGNLGTNDKNDASKNTVVAAASRSNIKWESRVMNMVGRVLDGKLHMDNDVEVVDDDKDTWQNAIREPKNENNKVNLVGDTKDAWQNEIGEVKSENKIEFNPTDNDTGSIMLSSNSPAEGSGLNGNQDLIPHAKSDFMKPKSRGENEITEVEGNYYVSDLVWGKVSCHPWWPGQIFSPISASSEADVYSKNGTYLIAYFGDGTFAWNNELKIKPFGMHFSKMGKQSNSEKFCHAVQCALDESSRRVEYGLSCPCLPQEMRDGIEFQVIENAGIKEEASRRGGGDVLSGAATFSPGDLLESLESLARRPQSEPDRLQFTIEKAQVLAYNRWKGRYVLPVYEECVCLLNAEAGVSSINKESTAIDGSSSKRKNLKGDASKGRRGKKPKNMLPICPDLVLTKLSLLAKKPMQGHNAMIPVVGFLSKFRKSVCPQTISQVNDATCSGEQPVFEIGNGVSSKKRKSTAGDGFSGKRKKLSGNKEGQKTKEKSLSVLMSSGNSSSVRSGPTNAIFSGEDCEMDNHEKEEPSNVQNANTIGDGGINDSYWTDRIIHGDSQDQVLLKPEADVASEEYCPTALILNFSDLEAIPAIPALKEIFTAFGPLVESETKILTKSKRAKVVFKRKEDAENAFSSTGKYKTFGPALKSYRLNFVINLDKKKKKKKTDSP